MSFFKYALIKNKKQKNMKYKGKRERELLSKFPSSNGTTILWFLWICESVSMCKSNILDTKWRKKNARPSLFSKGLLCQYNCFLVFLPNAN